MSEMARIAGVWAAWRRDICAGYGIGKCFMRRDRCLTQATKVGSGGKRRLSIASRLLETRLEKRVSVLTRALDGANRED